MFNVEIPARPMEWVIGMLGIVCSEALSESRDRAAALSCDYSDGAQLLVISHGIVLSLDTATG